MKNTKDMSVLVLEVNTKNGSYVGDLAEDLIINVDDISESYTDQPGKYAWWSVLSAQARAVANKIQAEVENQEDYVRKTLKGELDAQVRKDLELDGEKITETKVENGIYAHTKYKENMEKLYSLRVRYADANENAVILESARNALDQRKDMLISLGATLRADYSNTDLTMKKEQAKKILANKVK